MSLESANYRHAHKTQAYKCYTCSAFSFCSYGVMLLFLEIDYEPDKEILTPCGVKIKVKVKGERTKFIGL